MGISAAEQSWLLDAVGNVLRLQLRQEFRLPAAFVLSPAAPDPFHFWCECDGELLVHYVGHGDLFWNGVL